MQTMFGLSLFNTSRILFVVFVPSKYRPSPASSITASKNRVLAHAGGPTNNIPCLLSSSIAALTIFLISLNPSILSKPLGGWLFLNTKVLVPDLLDVYLHCNSLHFLCATPPIAIYLVLTNPAKTPTAKPPVTGIPSVCNRPCILVTLTLLTQCCICVEVSFPNLYQLTPLTYPYFCNS